MSIYFVVPSELSEPSGMTTLLLDHKLGAKINFEEARNQKEAVLLYREQESPFVDYFEHPIAFEISFCPLKY